MPRTRFHPGAAAPPRTLQEAASSRSVREAAVRYGCVAAACVVASLIAVLVRDLLPDPTAALLFSPIVCAAAMLWGFAPGIAATALAIICLSILGAPTPGATPYIFAVLGLTLSVCGEWVYRRQRLSDRSVEVLAEREAHLRSIYDTAPDGLIVIDEQGIMQSYSAGAERMFGWTASEALGRNVKMLMPFPYREEHDGYVRNYLTTGVRRIIGIGRIVVGERKDGSTFPMELAVGEVRSEQGRFFTGFVRDLTERQATETRLQELQAELVHMSRFTAMGEMASALAHELNQPLSAIANYMSGGRRLLERSGQGDPRVSEAMEKAGEQALRAGDIIRRLRDFLARGEGERSVELLPKLVHEACALAMVGAKESGVRVRYELDPRLDRVLVDRVQIQQVILNLVRNAIDAMQEAPTRELLVSTSPGEEHMAIVSVADTGPGLDPAAAARLFQPFVTTKPQGMGVGLSISRTIVEAHGGRIWTEANPGGGVIFRFSLRSASEADAAEDRHGQ